MALHPRQCAGQAGAAATCPEAVGPASLLPAPWRPVAGQMPSGEKPVLGTSHLVAAVLRLGPGGCLHPRHPLGLTKTTGQRPHLSGPRGTGTPFPAVSGWLSPGLLSLQMHLSPGSLPPPGPPPTHLLCTDPHPSTAPLPPGGPQPSRSDRGPLGVGEPPHLGSGSGLRGPRKQAALWTAWRGGCGARGGAGVWVGSPLPPRWITAMAPPPPPS